MIEVKRKDNESFDGLLRRFNKRLQQSRILLRIKEDRFHQRPVSKLKAKRRALKGAELKSEREYLKKVGRTPEPVTRKR